MCLSAAPSRAAILLDTNGFENPPFMAGLPLEGQGAPQTWLRNDLGTGASTSLVQTTVFESGSQAVQIVRGAMSDTRWGVPLGSLTPLQVSIQWDMLVEQTRLPVGSFGPFMGVEAYDDPNGSLPPPPVRLATFGVDAATGEFLFIGPGGLISAVPSVTVDFGQWRPYQLLLDFVSQTYSIFYNGALLLPPIGFETASSTFSDADIAAYAAAGDTTSQNATGTAFYDNFLITAEFVPEPMSIVVWGLIAATAAFGYRAQRWLAI
jgi:hypothetical protein